MVSFVITLVRIWGRFPTGEYRERLDHFLHMMLSVRILAFQSLVESDIQAFEHHYGLYLAGLTKLYPYETRTCVQHLGLHIPTFLRALGPSTRFSESTCEMFNSLLQDISNNFKFGEMEITLHREFIMAARLKGLLQSKPHTSQLGEFGILTQKYIQKRVPGYAQQAWHAAHSANSARVDDAVYQCLCDWSNSASARSPSRQLFLCSSIQRGNLFYAPFASASGDSCVLFSPPCGPSSTPSDPIPGRIDAILKEPDEAVPANSQARILLLIRPFLSLEPRLAQYDPYWNHPIIGEHGARLARIYYDQVQDFTYVIEPKELVAHVVVCNYHDPDHTFPQPCVVVLSLDLKHKRYA
ncbi:hypothetical protein FRC08_001919 [Ceratobasidium sp. 394]|nr:hypothetical protein FRC08_001919 [Ceratobasidium sp. 394]